MQVVAEVPSFIRLAAKLLSEDERQDLIRFLSEHPKAGALIEDTGGVRKLRWGRGGRGKSGGVRVIYYFHSDFMPLYLLTLYAKSDQANLSQSDKAELAKLTQVLADIWRAKKS